ncbi:hypothetical protein H9P43_001223 [Blastocladiella emersonii ATCC 22665]|nr:hypothetical protein H9P43_001223 [Blastocladiella emersonii ATCC 22665]
MVLLSGPAAMAMPRTRSCCRLLLVLPVVALLAYVLFQAHSDRQELALLREQSANWAAKSEALQNEILRATNDAAKNAAAAAAASSEHHGAKNTAGAGHAASRHDADGEDEGKRQSPDELAAAGSEHANDTPSEPAADVLAGPSAASNATVPEVDLNISSPPPTSDRPPVPVVPPSGGGGPSAEEQLAQFRSRIDAMPLRVTDPRWDQYVIGLKSGIEVAVDKVPIQLATFLQGVRNMFLFGDAEMQIGDYRMVDVVTGAHERAEAALKANYKKFPTKQPYGSLPSSPAKHSQHKDQKKGTHKQQERRQPEQKQQERRQPEQKQQQQQQHDHADGDGKPLHKRGAPNVAPSAKDREVVPDQKSRGWKLDAYKNIPAVREMYHRYPDAKWYIMIDDDTYVFMENLHRVLSALDPSEPHYVGAPNHFRDCDGITKLGDGPMFAHGGSGIAISREAARRMSAIADECIVRYDDCWAGDVRLGLCLRDAGILINYAYPGRRWFNPVTPHWSVHPYYEDPCKRVVTFHHLSQATMQKLYDIERFVHGKAASTAPPPPPPPAANSTSSPITAAAANVTAPPLEFAHLGLPPHIPSPYTSPIHLEDIWHHFVDQDPALPEIEHDIARSGENYLVYTGAKDPGHCRWLCERDAKCRAWEFEPNGRCSVKESITRPVPAKGHASGLIKYRFRCTERTI